MPSISTSVIHALKHTRIGFWRMYQNDLDAVTVGGNRADTDAAILDRILSLIENQHEKLQM